MWLDLVTLLIGGFPKCYRSIPDTQKLSSALEWLRLIVYHQSSREICKSGNSIIQDLATMLSDSVKIAAIQFPMPKNISRHKIIFIGKLGDKLWRNNEKYNFWFLKKNLANFSKT